MVVYEVLVLVLRTVLVVVSSAEEEPGAVGRPFAVDDLEVPGTASASLEDEP